VLLIAFLEEAIIRNKIIILFINYNTVVINNNLWKTPRLYFALETPHWHAKEFCFGNLQTIRHAPTKYSANCGLWKSLLYFKAGLANMLPSIT
jgi:hypothetical protein